MKALNHLATVHELHSLFSEKEIDMVLIFNGTNKIRTVQFFEVVLGSPELFLDDQGIRPRKV